MASMAWPSARSSWCWPPTRPSGTGSPGTTAPRCSPLAAMPSVILWTWRWSPQLWRAPASASCGGTPPAKRHWLARPRRRVGRPGDRHAVGGDPGRLLQAHPQAGVHDGRFSTTSSSRAGRRPRSWRASGWSSACSSRWGYGSSTGAALRVFPDSETAASSQWMVGVGAHRVYLRAFTRLFSVGGARRQVGGPAALAGRVAWHAAFSCSARCTGARYQG